MTLETDKQLKKIGKFMQSKADSLKKKSIKLINF